MFYLIGINHWYQYKNDEKTQEFLKYVRAIIKEKSIEVLAEEWNTDADKLNEITQSNLAALAKELNKTLLQFEALENQQTEFGIMTKVQMSAQAREQVPHIQNFEDIQKKEKIIQELRKQNLDPRENYWLGFLKPYFDKTVLLICGNDHIITFGQKLKNAGAQFEVLSTGVWTLPEFYGFEI